MYHTCMSCYLNETIYNEFTNNPLHIPTFSHYSITCLPGHFCMYLIELFPADADVWANASKWWKLINLVSLDSVCTYTVCKVPVWRGWMLHMMRLMMSVAAAICIIVRRWSKVTMETSRSLLLISFQHHSSPFFSFICSAARRFQFDLYLTDHARCGLNFVLRLDFIIYENVHHEIHQHVFTCN